MWMERQSLEGIHRSDTGDKMSKMVSGLLSLWNRVGGTGYDCQVFNANFASNGTAVCNAEFEFHGRKKMVRLCKECKSLYLSGRNPLSIHFNMTGVVEDYK